jgi:hypothetical protein
MPTRQPSRTIGATNAPTSPVAQSAPRQGDRALPPPHQFVVRAAHHHLQHPDHAVRRCVHHLDHPHAPGCSTAQALRGRRPCEWRDRRRCMTLRADRAPSLTQNRRSLSDPARRSSDEAERRVHCLRRAVWRHRRRERSCRLFDRYLPMRRASLRSRARRGVSRVRPPSAHHVRRARRC